MKYKSGYRYISQEPVALLLPSFFPPYVVQAVFASLIGSRLTVMDRYAWDGASFILFTLFGTPTRWLVPSLVHDALYQLMQDGLLPLRYRKDADLLFYQLLRTRGAWWISATVAYYAVHWFGNYFARHGRKVREVV